MTSLRSILTTAVLAGFTAVAYAVPPPPSPGLPIGQTAWDEQQVHSMGHQTARTSGSDIPHFIWTSWDRIPANAAEFDRWVAYDCLTIPGPLEGCGGFGGTFVSSGILAQAGYANIAVKANNGAQISLQQRSDPSLPPTLWRLDLPIPGNSLHIDDEMPPGQYPEFQHPRIAAERDVPDTAVIHLVGLVAPESDYLLYWRFDGALWTGPVMIDSTPTSGYVLACDATSERVAIILHDDGPGPAIAARNIAYYESHSSGTGWVNSSELGASSKQLLTAYTSTSGPQAFVHVAAAYDNSGVLHIIWDEEQQTGSPQTIIRHWNSQRGTIRPVTTALWDGAWSTGINSLYLSKLSLGIGDGGTLCTSFGTNNNVLYVVYTRFGGPAAAEEADHSLSGYYNGELYLNASVDGGNTWSAPANLSNTKTPKCNPGPADTVTGMPIRPDSVCRSEHWASVGEIVDDIDILFVSDIDAGAIPYGEGTWQLNPVHYLRLPGGTTNSAFVCPSVGPAMAASLTGGDSCGFHASPSGQTVGTLLLINSGNAELSGTVSVNDFPAEATLTTSADGPFTIPAGGTDLVITVTMSSNGAATGSYAGQIVIDHNDATIPDPLVINVSLEVGLCQCHTDPVCDGATNVQDVIEVIGRAFRGDAGSYDAMCPDDPPYIDGRTDLDCDGATSVVDVVLMVNVAFRGASAQTEFCHICQ